MTARAAGGIGGPGTEAALRIRAAVETAVYADDLAAAEAFYGEVWQLGADDFGGAIPKHIASQARLNAKKRGLAVRCQKVEGGGIVIQAYKPEGGEAQAPAEVGEEVKPAAKETSKKRGKKS